jgi:hypothetical protein
MSEVPIGKIMARKINFTVNESISNLIVAIGITDVHDYPIATTWSLPQRLEKGDYVARFTEKLVNYNTGNYKLLGFQRVHSIDYIDNEVAILFSEVVKEQDDAIVNNKSGLITNQMLVEFEQKITHNV